MPDRLGVRPLAHSFYHLGGEVGISILSLDVSDDGFRIWYAVVGNPDLTYAHHIQAEASDDQGHAYRMTNIDASGLESKLVLRRISFVPALPRDASTLRLFISSNSAAESFDIEIPLGWTGRSGIAPGPQG